MPQVGQMWDKWDKAHGPQDLTSLDGPPGVDHRVRVSVRAGNIDIFDHHFFLAKMASM